MLGAAKVPGNPLRERTRLLREGAEKAGYGNLFEQLPLAVTFDENWPAKADDRYDAKHSKKRINEHGVEQGTCVHLGNCDIGCDVNARNTLDLNYLAVAEKKGADVRPLHIVRDIKPIAGGYQVAFQRIVGGTMNGGTLTAKRVVVAAGSLGSTHLLLLSKASGSLPNLSPRLGVGWSSNGDFLTPAIHPFREVQPSRGPTITAAINLLNGEYQGKSIFIEDGGIPDIGRAFLDELSKEPHSDPRAQRMAATLLPLFANGGLLKNIMPWFAQSRDAADGRFRLENGRLMLDWNIAASEDTMNAVTSMHRKLAFVTEGIPMTPLTWTIGKDLITPHPLGGCNMGTDASRGVVDFRGEVFNYPGVYVADGAIGRKGVGPQPSRPNRARRGPTTRRTTAN